MDPEGSNRVVGLGLSYSELQGTIPKSIGELPFLQMFVCSGNEGLKGSIPSSFANLTRLEKLWCKNTGLDCELPESVRALPGLDGENRVVMPPPKPKPVVVPAKAPAPVVAKETRAESTPTIPVAQTETVPVKAAPAPASTSAPAPAAGGVVAGPDPRVKGLEARVKELESEVDKQVDKFKDAHAEIKELKQSNDIIRQIKESLEASISANRGLQAEKLAEIDVWRERGDKAIASLDKETGSRDKVIAGLNKDLTDEKENKEKVTSKLKGEIDALNQKLDLSSGELSVVKEKIQEFNDEAELKVATAEKCLYDEIKKTMAGEKHIENLTKEKDALHIVMNASVISHTDEIKKLTEMMKMGKDDEVKALTELMEQKSSESSEAASKAAETIVMLSSEVSTQSDLIDTLKSSKEQDLEILKQVAVEEIMTKERQVTVLQDTVDNQKERMEKVWDAEGLADALKQKDKDIVKIKEDLSVREEENIQEKNAEMSLLAADKDGQLKDKSKEMSKMEEEVAGLQDQLEAKVSMIEKLNSRCDELKKDLANTNAAKDKEIEHLNSMNSDMSKDEELQVLQSLCETKALYVSQKDDEIEALRERLENEVNSLTEKHTESSTKSKELISIKDNEIATLKEEMEQQLVVFSQAQAVDKVDKVDKVPTQSIAKRASFISMQTSMSQVSDISGDANAVVGGTNKPPKPAPISMNILNNLHSIFDKIDANNDGELNVREVILGLRKNEELREILRLPQHIRQEDGTRDDFEKLFSAMDSSEDRSITFNEFSFYIMKHMQETGHPDGKDLIQDDTATTAIENGKTPATATAIAIEDKKTEEVSPAESSASSETPSTTTTTTDVTKADAAAVGEQEKAKAEESTATASEPEPEITEEEKTALEEKVKQDKKDAEDKARKEKKEAEEKAAIDRAIEEERSAKEKAAAIRVRLEEGCEKLKKEMEDKIAELEAKADQSVKMAK